MHMSFFFASLPEPSGELQILELYPEAGRALIELHTAVLRNESALSAGVTPGGSAVTGEGGHSP